MDEPHFRCSIAICVWHSAGLWAFWFCPYLCLLSLPSPFALYLTYTHTSYSGTFEFPYLMLACICIFVSTSSLCLGHSVISHKRNFNCCVYQIQPSSHSSQQVFPKPTFYIIPVFNLSNCLPIVFSIGLLIRQWPLWGTGQCLIHLNILHACALAHKRHSIHVNRLELNWILKKMRITWIW